MSSKVTVEVTCPNCHSVLRLTKKAELVTKNIKCPGKDCGIELHIVFDVTKDPQTYQLVDEEQVHPKVKEKKTIYKKDTDFENGDQYTAGHHQEGGYGQDKHKTPHKTYDDFDDDFDDDDDNEYVPRKKHRLRERIYLTHITWFGLRNQRYQLHEGTTTIGRFDEDDTSDIMIRGDETMSRRSVAIIIEEEDGIFDYKLKVMNATNKVRVNDQSVKVGDVVYLDMGDIIMLGNSKFKFDNH